MNLNEDTSDTHFCLCCHATIVGLENYVTHKQSLCSSIRKTASSSSEPASTTTIPSASVVINPSSEANDLAQRVIDPNEILFTSNPTTSQADPSINDFLTSLDLQIRPATAVAKDSKRNNELSPKAGVGIESMEQTSGLFENAKQQLKLLNDFEFNSDSEGFMPSDTEDLLNFSDEEVNERSGGGKLRVSRGKPSGKLLATFKNLDKCQEVSTAAPRTGGKWRPGERPTGYHRGGKWHSIGKQSVYPDEEEEEEDEKVNDVTDDNAQKEALLEISQGDQPLEGQSLKNSPVEPLDNTSKKTVEKRDYKCCTCDKVFNNKYNYSRHLRSTLHARRAKNSEIQLESLDEEERMIVLRMKKYQCRICNFYCSDRGSFCEHCVSEVHQEAVRGLLGPVKCTVCKFQSRDCPEMLEHLNSKEHDTKMQSGHSKLCILKEPRSSFVCPLCQATKTSVAAFRFHMDLHKKKNFMPIKRGVRTKRKCDVCDKEFRDNFNLAMHVRRRHSNERRFPCDACKVGFADKASLQSHYHSQNHMKQLLRLSDNSSNSAMASTGQQGKKFKCRCCNFVTDEEKHLRPHYIMEHVKKTFQCETCGMSFKTRKSHARHLKSPRHRAKALRAASTLGANEAVCDQCGEKFYDLQKYKLHEAMHADDTKETSKSKSIRITVDARFHGFLESLGMDLNKGMTRRDNNSRVGVSCPACGKKVSQGYIVAHLRAHSKTSPFCCVHCTKRFNDRVALQRHLRMHLGIKPFKCKHCSFEFHRQSHLLNHMSRAHHEPKTLPNLCAECGQSFSLQSQLNVHVKRKHVPDSKQYKCPTCSKSFLFKSELTYHQRCHTNERPFLCDQCNYSGKTQNQLTRHQKTHTGEKTFCCEYCTYKASHSSNLKRHMRIHTGAKPFLCPYCPYTCNSMENICKHIKRTKKHQGLKLYPCRLCDNSFATDSAKEFQAHVVSCHQEETKGLSSVMAGIYCKGEDVCLLPEGSRALPLRENKRTRKILQNDHAYTNAGHV